MGPFGFKDDWGAGRTVRPRRIGGLAGVVGVGMVDVVGGFGALVSVVTGATTGAVVLIRATTMDPGHGVVIDMTLIRRNRAAGVHATPIT